MNLNPEAEPFIPPCVEYYYNSINSFQWNAATYPKSKSESNLQEINSNNQKTLFPLLHHPSPIREGPSRLMAINAEIEKNRRTYSADSIRNKNN